jgi:hypothetical protein
MGHRYNRKKVGELCYLKLETLFPLKTSAEPLELHDRMQLCFPKQFSS